MTKKEAKDKTNQAVKQAFRYGAFVLLVVLANYGLRQMFVKLDDLYRDGLSVIFTIYLAWTVISK